MQSRMNLLRALGNSTACLPLSYMVSTVAIGPQRSLASSLLVTNRRFVNCFLEDHECTREIVRPEDFRFIPSPLSDDGSVQ